MSVVVVVESCSKAVTIETGSALNSFLEMVSRFGLLSDRWVGGWTGGRTDGRTDRQIYVYQQYLKVVLLIYLFCLFVVPDTFKAVNTRR